MAACLVPHPSMHQSKSASLHQQSSQVHRYSICPPSDSALHSPLSAGGVLTEGPAASESGAAADASGEAADASGEAALESGAAEEASPPDTCDVSPPPPDASPDDT